MNYCTKLELNLCPMAKCLPLVGFLFVCLFEAQMKNQCIIIHNYSKRLVLVKWPQGVLK